MSQETHTEPAATYLLILSEREAVAWVLEKERMAFPARRRAEVDRLILLTTRGCWHNPTRDRTRLIGTAEVTSPVRALDEPVTIAGRDFTRGCDLKVERGDALPHWCGGGAAGAGARGLPRHPTGCLGGAVPTPPGPAGPRRHRPAHPAVGHGGR